MKWEKCLGGPYYNVGTGIACSSNGYLLTGYVNVVGYSINLIYVLNYFDSNLISLQFGGPTFEQSNSIISYKNGYAIIGTTASESFSEGINLGHMPGQMDDAFISYINYNLLNIPNVSSKTEQINIFPNPTNGIINILLPTKNGKLIIINYLGEKIYINNNNKKYIDVDTKNWANGIYIAIWQGEDGNIITHKFIKY